MTLDIQSQPRLRAFLDVVPWDFRSRNTDWRYVRFLLPRLAEFQPQLDLVLQTSRRINLQANLKAVRMALGRRIGLPLALRECETDLLDAAELRRSGASVVFSHRGFPVNAGNLPVIWQSSILDPAMMLSYTGLDESAMRPEWELRHELFQRAALVQVSTEAEATRLSRTFPELAGRFVPVPFFLPDLAAAPEQCLERHRSPKTIEVLFVGNDAHRKGLDLLLDAFTSLPATLARRVNLTVVSNFDGAKVAIPGHAGITVHRGLPQSAVLQLMRNAHILVNVARFESYGFIFLEAMSQGAVCLGPAWEVQRELLDDGRAGLNLPCNADEIRAALQPLIEADPYRLSLAAAARTRFIEQYQPGVVAAKYAAMFCRAAGY